MAWAGGVAAAIEEEKRKKKEKERKWECVEVKHHKDVGKTIEEYERKSWRLHTYQIAGMGTGPMAYNISHYRLFEKVE
jgi:hypothetical protein